MEGDVDREGTGSANSAAVSGALFIGKIVFIDISV